MHIIKSLDIFRGRSCGLLSDDAAGVTGLSKECQIAGKAVLMGRCFRNASADGAPVGRGAFSGPQPLDSALSFPLRGPKLPPLALSLNEMARTHTKSQYQGGQCKLRCRPWLQRASQVCVTCLRDVHKVCDIFINWHQLIVLVFPIVSGHPRLPGFPDVPHLQSRVS